MPNYSKTLTLHRGVDNQLQFQFLNQEQRPVDITGKTIVCRILDYTASVILLEKELTPILAATGITSLQVNAADLDGLDPQKCYYTLQIPVNEFNYPVYVDGNAGARGDLNIVDSVLPKVIPSATVIIPTSQTFPNTYFTNNTYNLPNNSAVTYNTSTIATNNRSIITLQTKYSGYSGTTKIQGSTSQGTDWYDISSTTYSNYTDTVGATVTGYHPYIRMTFTSTTGEVTEILSR